MGGCYHCGEPLPAKGHYSLIIDGQERAMCCPACVAVSETILGAGLDDYYRLRDQQASRPNDGAEDSCNTTALLYSSNSPPRAMACGRASSALVICIVPPARG